MTREQPAIPSRVLANVEAAITTLRGIAAQVQSATTALDGRLGGGGRYEADVLTNRAGRHCVVPGSGSRILASSRRATAWTPRPCWPGSAAFPTSAQAQPRPTGSLTACIMWRKYSLAIAVGNHIVVVTL